ncbi:MAG: hypothetical protein K9N55_10200 [Phycisphaerae bacterium]|nr:hypothetical protein [Phycisphaerae bacterium]
MKTTFMVQAEEGKQLQVLSRWLDAFKDVASVEHADRYFVKLAGKNVTRDNVEDGISGTHEDYVDIFVYYGHGTRCCVCVAGTNGEAPTKPSTFRCDNCGEHDRVPVKISLVDEQNIHLFAGKDIYTIACSSRKLLGTFHTENKPNGAYFGFEEKVILPNSPCLRACILRIMNKGLEVLHKDSKNNTDRYQKVKMRVLSGLDELAWDIRRSADDPSVISTDEWFVVQWRHYFKSTW